MDKKQLVKYIKDPRFYLENFVKIKGKTPGLAPFILNPAQLDIFNTLRTSYRTIILKARQIGFSTAITGWLYHKTITSPGTNTALIGYNSDLTAELLDKVKTFWRTTDPAIRPQIQYNSKHEISFPAIDSKIVVLPSTENVGRGYTLHNVLCVSGNTTVFSENGIPKKISEVSVGDIVINGSGGKSKVSRVVKSSGLKKKMVSIDVTGADEVLNVTEDHKILTRDGWKQAGVIKKGDFVAYPYFQLRNRVKKIDLSIYPVKKGSFIVGGEVEINRDFGEICGWFAAEGSVNRGRVMFSVHENEVEYLVGLLRRVFGNFLGKIGVNKNKDSLGCVISITSQQLSCFFVEKFGSGAKNKTISDSVWYWGWEFGYGFLKGVFLGDGHFSKNDRTVELRSISPSLVYQVKKLLVSLRIGLASIQSYEASRYGVPSQRTYSLSLCGPGNYKFRRKLGFQLPMYNNGRFRWILENDPGRNYGWKTWVRGKFHYWMKVRSVKEVLSEEFVYDISLPTEPHSFLTHAGVVSNCTELAFWEKADEKMLAIENSVPRDGRIIIESTPNGLGNVYHRTWMADNGYAKKKYGWWWHYSEQEIEEIRKRINNPMKFAQEYELEFLSSGRLVFDKGIVEQMRPYILKVGEAIRHQDGSISFVKEMPDGLRIYKEPVPGRMYIIGGDVAEGVIGGDYSVAVVFDRETGEEVAYWRGHISADKFGVMIDKWGRMYNEALAVVEMNNHGLTTLTTLKNLLYPRMYFRPSKFDSISSSWGDRIGWRTTRVTRPLMIDDAAEMLREGSIIIHSQEILNEMLTFVYDAGGNMICQKGFHDDSIFAMAICLQGFKTMSKEPLDQLNYESHLPMNYSY